MSSFTSQIGGLLLVVLGMWYPNFAHSDQGKDSLISIGEDPKLVIIVQEYVPGSMRMDAGLSWFWNAKEGNSGLRAHYYSRRFIKNRVRIRLEGEGYRLTEFGVPEYNRFFLGSDYYLTGNRGWAFFPYAGIEIVKDITDIDGPNKGWSANGKVGMDLNRMVSNWGRLSLRDGLTFFRDGAMLEVRPGFGVKIPRTFIWIQAHINCAMALTYSGNFDMGFFPGLGFWLLR